MVSSQGLARRVSRLALANGFVKNDTNGRREIKAARVFHWDRKAFPGMLLEEALGKAAGFTSENEIVFLFEGSAPVRLLYLGGEKVETTLWTALPGQLSEAFPKSDIDVGPIVEAGAAQGLLFDGKAERLDEVQARAGRKTKSADIARVGRDLRRDEYDVEHR